MIKLGSQGILFDRDERGHRLYRLGDKEVLETIQTRKKTTQLPQTLKPNEMRNLNRSK